MRPIIVYYVVGPVHPRNLALLAAEMPDWAFRIIYEPDLWWLSAKTLAKLPFENVPLSANQVPDALWSGDVRAVVFSTVQPRPGPIALLRSALERGIPTIAIEESNQIALNAGTINNYLLPVDHLLVASEHERKGMLEAGIPASRVEVTGWPFYAGAVGRTPRDRSQAKKAFFGLDPDRPVVTLTLTALNDAGESPAVRRRQLTLASEGLGPEYQLIVKPHPIEKLQTLMPFVEQYAPRARVIDGSVKIDQVLEATDVLLNRGASQVCIEALFREIPVLVLDTGVHTPFHESAPDLIAASPGALGRIITRLSPANDPMQAYARFRENHMPHSPSEARALTCKRIAQIAQDGLQNADCSIQWFDLILYQAWQASPGSKSPVLSRGDTVPADPTTRALERLVQRAASREDLSVLKACVGDGFRSHVLRGLWIDQLAARHAVPTSADLEWMHGFPLGTNTVWFLRNIDQWANILWRSDRDALKAYSQRLSRDFMHVPGIADIVQKAELHDAGLWERTKFLLRRVTKRARAGTARLKARLNTLR